jgi:phospholipid transport system substrate-binding protein
MSVFLFALVVCHGLPALADEPQADLKAAIDRGIAVLRDPQYQEERQKAVQSEKFWAEIRQIFDFTEVSKRALARNWRRFSTEEKKAFITVFSELLGNTYVQKIQEEFANQDVVYLSQETIKTNRAIVKTKVTGGGVEIPVEYRLHNNRGPWKVYDVYVEGVSLVGNYRTQFNKFLINKSPEQLIQRLEKKVEQLKS